MNEEYKPGFKAWLFAVILAAGFGSLLADGIRYFVIESGKSDAKLELRDKHCRKENDRLVCTYYFENTGDKLAYVTDVIVDGIDHPIFFTNSPIQVFLADINKPIKRAHIAIAEPNKMLMISIAVVDTENEPSQVCFINGGIELKCILSE